MKRTRLVRGIPKPFRGWQTRLLFILYLIICTAPLQTATAQVPNSFDITLEEMGYGERVLIGPESSARYYFGLPANWEPQIGSYVELDLDYMTSNQETYAPVFLRVELNDTLLHTEALTLPAVFQIHVDIHPDLLFLPGDPFLNTLKLEFRVYDECEKAMLTSLTVRPSSLLHLVYREMPLRLDLALYPAPIYDRYAFEPGEVRFVLPSQPDSAEVRSATMIAARLGELTSARLPISATLSSDLPTSLMPQEHLMVIGRPDDQPFIQQLDLPVPVVERQLDLTSEMPTTVAAGDLISYTLAVKNSSTLAQSLAVEDRLPAGGTFSACSGQCVEARPGVIRWDIGLLPAGEEISTTVTVRLDELLPTLVPPDAVVEHTASLFDDQGNVLNVDTLSAQVGTATSETWVTSRDKVKSGYFFVHDNQGVAEGDGLLQEVISPWSSSHAAVVVTGLDEEALLRAAQALSSDSRSPGMWGSYAVVQATHPISESVTGPAEDLSFAALGYENETIGAYLDNFDVTFHVPPGWKLSDDSYVAVHFAHGAALNEIAATLEVLLNDLSIGSVTLDESNVSDSWMTFPLSAAASRTGSNWIRLRATADLEHWCKSITSDRYWLTVYDDSFLHLPRQETGLLLDLDIFPYPFSNDPDLEDVAFLLPEQVTSTEMEGVLRLAFQMGSVAGGNDFSPQAVLGGQPGESRNRSGDVESWTDYHLIAVGVPTSNHYLATVSEELPQPFRPGTDEILQEIDRMVYRLPPGVSLGYVQELLSPWGKDRAMLAIMGTTDEGVAWALTALNDDQLQGELFGNLALIRDREVRSMDTREIGPEGVISITKGLEPDLVSVVTTTPTPTPTMSATPTAIPATATPTPTASASALLAAESRSPSGAESPAVSSSRPVWLIPLLILGAVTLLVAVGVGVWRARS